MVELKTGRYLLSSAEFKNVWAFYFPCHPCVFVTWCVYAWSSLQLPVITCRECFLSVGINS